MCLAACADTQASQAPIGIRTNNPGNLELKDNWKGLRKSLHTARFAAFSTPEYGIRAMCHTIQTYDKVYGINTIKRIIQRYSPSKENGKGNTLSYITNVAKWSGIDRNIPIDTSDLTVMTKIIQAMIRQENGYSPYADSLVYNSCKL